MAIELPIGVVGTLTAAADLSAQQYHLVQIDTVADDRVAAVTAATQPAVGVLQNKPTAGGEAEIMVLGITKAVAGAAITRGAELMADTSGRVITQAANAGANRVVGYALESAGGAGEIISVLILGLVRMV